MFTNFTLSTKRADAPSKRGVISTVAKQILPMLIATATIATAQPNDGWRYFHGIGYEPVFSTKSHLARWHEYSHCLRPVSALVEYSYKEVGQFSARTGYHQHAVKIMTQDRENHPQHMRYWRSTWEVSSMAGRSIQLNGDELHVYFDAPQTAIWRACLYGEGIEFEGWTRYGDLY